MTMIFMQIMGKYFRLKRKQLLHMRRRTPGIRKPTCLYHWLMLTLTRSVSREEPGKTRDTRDSLAVGGHVTRYTWQSGSGRRCRTLSLCWSSSPSTVGALNLHTTPRIRLSGTTWGERQYWRWGWSSINSIFFFDFGRNLEQQRYRAI